MRRKSAKIWKIRKFPRSSTSNPRKSWIFCVYHQLSSLKNYPPPFEKLPPLVFPRSGTRGGNFSKSTEGRNFFKLPNALKRPKMRFLSNLGPPQAEFFWGFGDLWEIPPLFSPNLEQGGNFSRNLVDMNRKYWFYIFNNFKSCILNEIPY